MTMPGDERAAGGEAFERFKALADYARHREGCDWYKDRETRDAPCVCSCGLLEIFEGKLPQREKHHPSCIMDTMEAGDPDAKCTCGF